MRAGKQYVYRRAPAPAPGRWCRRRNCNDGRRQRRGRRVYQVRASDYRRARARSRPQTNSAAINLNLAAQNNCARADAIINMITPLPEQVAGGHGRRARTDSTAPPPSRRTCELNQSNARAANKLLTWPRPQPTYGRAYGRSLTCGAKLAPRAKELWATCVVCARVLLRRARPLAFRPNKHPNKQQHSNRLWVRAQIGHSARRRCGRARALGWHYMSKRAPFPVR